jgi:hypothetical protein
MAWEAWIGPSASAFCPGGACARPKGIYFILLLRRRYSKSSEEGPFMALPNITAFRAMIPDQATPTRDHTNVKASPGIEAANLNDAGLAGSLINSLLSVWSG